MALIEGLTKFAGEASVTKEDLERNYRLVVNQLGGYRWTSGVEASASGNLDSSNFRETGAGITNVFKNEPYTLVRVPVFISTIPDAVTVQSGLVLPIAANAYKITMCPSGLSGGAASYDVAATPYVNGAAATSVQLVTNGTVGVFAQLSLGTGGPDSALPAGTLVELSINNTSNPNTDLQNVMVEFWFKILHTAI